MKKQLLWLIPTLIFLVIAPFTPWIDIHLSKTFYNGGFSKNSIYSFIYVWGLIPGQLLALVSMVALIFSYFFKRFKKIFPFALVIVLTTAIGAGLITHTFFKDRWGRPRPKQIEAFGGEQHYRPFWSPNFFNQPEPSKSFPCGHCSMGFLFFTLFFIGRRLKNNWFKYLGLALALILGIALSVTRIAQGGHFFSDVFASALIMWLSAYFLSNTLLTNQLEELDF